MSSTTLPTVVFLPGAWHLPNCFDLVRHDLESLGYETEAVAFPSVGTEPPNKGLADDAAAARSVIERLVDQGKQVVLAVHSYGGLVGANAVEGLGYKQRAKEGKKGGVILFAYIAAFVVGKGGSLLGQLGNQWLPWMIPSALEGDLGQQSGYVTIDNPEEVMYHDVEPELRKKLVSELKHQSAPVFSGTVTYEPWLDIECMYYFSEDDKALPIMYQEKLAQNLPSETLRYRSKTSHSPFLSKPREVAKALVEAAKIGQERTLA
ncbi:Alpha/beta hydrolase fold-1 [Truncatella angustata]|uniref:Alpha/beta hydrolase fold-1 n=1 Tax=Truncatella angustata TaxID=152316 RepID=A0A9P8UTT3_9PEZI|nr:Alpha/beta hydrolase fold-1 [Truncatella angustata]KAH6659019.1 Alpha/beta hydrolase fold-1 [Truncatella angustata]KAH8200693.1 hypothetical protein TruAng_005157 [Truncatella angustata]